MPKLWALIDRGVVQNVYSRDDDADPREWAPLNASKIVEATRGTQAGDKYDGANFSPAETSRIIPSYDFWQRIPKKKRHMVREYATGAGTAAMSNPDFILEIADWLDMLRMGGVAELDAPELRAGLNRLVTVGILNAADRKDALV